MTYEEFVAGAENGHSISRDTFENVFMTVYGSFDRFGTAQLFFKFFERYACAGVDVLYGVYCKQRATCRKLESIEAAIENVRGEQEIAEREHEARECMEELLRTRITTTIAMRV